MFRKCKVLYGYISGIQDTNWTIGLFSSTTLYFFIYSAIFYVMIHMLSKPVFKHQPLNLYSRQ